jgi:hypothetical protein
MAQDISKHWEWLIDDSRETIKFETAKYLDIVSRPLTSTKLPAILAAQCWGEPALVYDVTARLTTPGMFDVGAALSGNPPGFVQPDGVSLVKFIEANSRGVIIFDDLQAFSPRAIATLAEIADSNVAVKEGAATASLSARGFVILATARMAIPSPNELMWRANRTALWEPDLRPPPSFRDLIRQLAQERYPGHFQSDIVGRFDDVDAGFVWERYCELLGLGRMDEAIFDEPVGVAVPPVPPQPAVRDLVPDVSAIEQLPLASAPYDVFISYSWTRTAADAGWLRTELKSRGFRVFFDKDDLDISGVTDEQVKMLLIQRLTAIVQDSRAWVVFSAALRPLSLASELSLDDALKRGLAMEVGGAPVEWSWQTLELRHMGRRLVIGDSAAYIVKEDGTWDSHYGQREIDTRQDILNYVIDYLADRGVMPVE